MDREPSSTDEEIDLDWHKPYPINGVAIANAFQEIQDFAYRAFEVMDRDSDGFVSREELNHFLNASSTSLRAKSFIRFMLFRLDDIKKAFIEEHNPETDGISREDIREYFNGMRPQG
ncbi:MAG TPA: hypothetical protein V6C76_00980 [Drouetiella sp.]